MLEMFTDQDPMRSDDFKLPADMGGIVLNKTRCYNSNVVGDRPPPIKSEEIMKQTNLSMADIMTKMSVQHEADEKTPLTIFTPKKGEMVTIRHGLFGYRMPILSIVHNFKTDSVMVQFEQIKVTPLVFNSEEDINAAKLVMEVWQLK